MENKEDKSECQTVVMGCCRDDGTCTLQSKGGCGCTGKNGEKKCECPATSNCKKRNYRITPPMDRSGDECLYFAAFAMLALAYIYTYYT